jgi:26S proteasome regulatory subunit T1
LLKIEDIIANRFFRARRKVATEKDFLAAVDKVIKGNLKFNSTATYMQYN